MNNQKIKNLALKSHRLFARHEYRKIFEEYCSAVLDWKLVYIVFELFSTYLFLFFDWFAMQVR
jgi:hypothetical protein